MADARRVDTPELVLGPVTSEWCPDCKAHTLGVGPVLALTQDGVTRVGRWGVCEVCQWTPHAGNGLGGRRG